MEVMNILVLFGLLGVLASGFVAGNVITQSALKMLTGDASLKSSTGLGESGKNGPLNVILLLIDGLYNRTDVTADLENQDIFPVHGFLKTCTNDNVYNGPEIGCDCDEKMRSSIASLLSWAERVKGMSTHTLSELQNGIPNHRARDGQRHASPLSLEIESLIKNEGATNPSRVTYDSYRRLEITSRIFEELSSPPDNIGQLVIIRIRPVEFEFVLKIYEHYILPSKTLTIITSSCPRNPPYTVPYFVGGFGSERISHVSMERIQDLIVSIRTVINENDQQVNVETKIKSNYFASDDLYSLEDISGSIGEDIKTGPPYPSIDIQTNVVGEQLCSKVLWRIILELHEQKC